MRVGGRPACNSVNVSNPTSLEARDVVSDWLIQTCCKGMRNQYGRAPYYSMLWCLRHDPHTGLRSKHLVLHDARENDARGWTPNSFTLSNLRKHLVVLHNARGNDARARTPNSFTFSTLRKHLVVPHDARESNTRTPNSFTFSILRKHLVVLHDARGSDDRVRPPKLILPFLPCSLASRPRGTTA